MEFLKPSSSHFSCSAPVMVRSSARRSVTFLRWDIPGQQIFFAEKDRERRPGDR
nr:hypothetical protein [Arthrobacter sp. Soil762]